MEDLKTALEAVHVAKHGKPGDNWRLIVGQPGYPLVYEVVGLTGKETIKLMRHFVRILKKHGFDVRHRPSAHTFDVRAFKEGLSLRMVRQHYIPEES